MSSTEDKDFLHVFFTSVPPGPGTESGTYVLNNYYINKY